MIKKIIIFGIFSLFLKKQFREIFSGNYFHTTFLLAYFDEIFRWKKDSVFMHL